MPPLFTRRLFAMSWFDFSFHPLFCWEHLNYSFNFSLAYHRSFCMNLFVWITLQSLNVTIWTNAWQPYSRAARQIYRVYGWISRPHRHCQLVFVRILRSKGCIYCIVLSNHCTRQNVENVSKYACRHFYLKTCLTLFTFYQLYQTIAQFSFQYFPNASSISLNFQLIYFPVSLFDRSYLFMLISIVLSFAFATFQSTHWFCLIIHLSLLGQPRL